MPNILITSNAKFQPFSFERYIQPYQLYNEAYKEEADAYDNLSAQAETLRQRALSEPDAEWSRSLLDYADSLQNQAYTMAREGMTPSTRSSLRKLKSQYGTTVVPVQNAIARQAELSKLAASRKPEDRMQYGAMPTIDELIADPTKTQVGYSGSDVEKSAMQLAAAAASRVRSSDFGNFTKYWMRQREAIGYDANSIRAFMEDSKNIPELHQAIQQVASQYGNFEGLSPTQQLIMGNEIMSGILKGATYKEENKYQQDPVAMAYLQQELDINKAQRIAALKGQQTANNILAPRVFEGADNEGSEITKRTEGFRQTANGFTTDELQNKAAALKKAQAELNKLGWTTEDQRKFDENIDKIGRARRSSYYTMSPELRNLSNRQANIAKYQAAVDKAQKEYNEELQYLTDLRDKYSHLGKNGYEAMAIGLELEKMQSAQQKSSFALNLKESEYNNARAGVANLINSIEEDNYKNSGKTLGVFDSEGNKVSYSDVQKMLNDDKMKSATIKISTGKNGGLKLVYDGKAYTIKGVQQLDEFNKRLSITNDYLSDFSKVDNANIISQEGLQRLSESGAINLNTVKKDDIEGSNYKSVVFQEPYTGEYVKVMTDNYGRVLAINTLSSELSGGATRDTYFMQLANQGLQQLLPLIADKRED